jgi:hypothetical protein
VLFDNIGYPFLAGTWKVDSRGFEREVLEFFAVLFSAPPKALWSYIPSDAPKASSTAFISLGS